jgi:hypothetical protein
MSEKLSDETVGERICLLCGAMYHGKYSKCPHSESKVSGFINVTELFKIINVGEEPYL